MRRLLVPSLVVALAAALTIPGVATAADKRMVTFDSASPDARRLTGAGLTFVFTRSFLRTRILAVRATAVPVGVVPKPSRDATVNRQLDALMGAEAGSGELYEITPDAEQGKVMIQAFCPGSTKGWLAIGPVYSRRPIKVHAFGDDPATGQIRLCAAMEFTWRGEWKLPTTGTGRTLQDVFKPDFGRPGS